MMPSAMQLLTERAEKVRAGCQEVPSPCVNVCRMAPTTGWCEGCFRTLEEIAGWGRQSDFAKRATWRLIEQRMGRVA
jgi:predicted Fe-S protein YdhL (DUF1289 family)